MQMERWVEGRPHQGWPPKRWRSNGW